MLRRLAAVPSWGKWPDGTDRGNAGRLPRAGPLHTAGPTRALSPMEKAWCYPVIADGRLYIRDTECLWCYDVKDSASKE